ncbi:hypothetical protein GT037_008330 [Alternaria burnsii]|uniref:Uncharacterized protein n=1 Tax=Alternaria burnsii TaxID=1187904 RepID=A0A8H7B2F8_9PLEO|nr:uncharacterized protein GT037_008330 [Alternaria burnsii]KAF7673715.1 hypothetical protein GT037_008330 [Alternaria burnsii]
MVSALGSQDGRSCPHPNHLRCILLTVDGDDAAGAATARPQFASPAPKNAKVERPARRRLRRKGKKKQKKEE